MQYKIKKFKDGQVSAKVETTIDNLNIHIRGNSYEDLFKAAAIKEAWDNCNNGNSYLTIGCLIGQRSDRRFNNGESFDLKVIAKFINSMNFTSVGILHPHSVVSLALIDNSYEINPLEYVEQALKDSGADCVVSPDAGAYKYTYNIAEFLKKEMIAANKVRDAEGNPLINVTGDVKDKSCLIVDDLADGGRTFNLLASKLKELGADKVFLYVTHGQFNYGFDELKEYIDHIYTTDSFRDIKDELVTQFKLNI